jgi:ferredoxin
VTGVSLGIAAPALVHAARLGRPAEADPQLLRPPGAGKERDFLALCVRCGHCLKVCPTNGLQPAMLKGGIEGLFAPYLVMSRGYCEYNCTLCGQVCPTGALPVLSMQEKHETVIGKAFFDLDRCLPWAEYEECICCEEHCPIPEKAIHFDTVQVRSNTGELVTLQRPRVIYDDCIGCGICENKCPVSPPAIHVWRAEHVKAETHGPGPGHRGQGRGLGAGGRRRQESRDPYGY